MPLTSARPPHIDLELHRLNTRRRAGLLMMYAPAMGLALTMTAAVSFPGAGRLTTAVAGVGVITILLGVVCAPLGVAMRILYAARLNTLSKRHDLDARDDLPPLRKGTHLGNWRIARFCPDNITLVHEPGSRILSFILRLAVEGILLAMLIAVILTVARAPNHHAPWLSILFVAIAATAISASLGGARLIIDNPATTPTIRFSGHRVWSLFYLAGWRIPLEELEDIEPRAARLTFRATHRTHTLTGFAQGPFARWQLRRLCHAILTEPPAPQNNASAEATALSGTAPQTGSH